MAHKEKKEKHKKKSFALDPTSESQLSMRLGYMQAYANEMRLALLLRDSKRVYEHYKGRDVNITPKPVGNLFHDEKFNALLFRLRDHPMLRADADRGASMQSMRATSAMSVEHSARALGAGRQSMDDIIKGIGSWTIWEKGTSFFSVDEGDDESTKSDEHNLPYIKIYLRVSKEFQFFDQNSSTVARDSPEGEEAMNDNRLYEYLTVGKGKIRRRSDAESQTNEILRKSRDINTITLTTDNKDTYVSNYEMYDTFQQVREAMTPGNGMDNASSQILVKKTASQIFRLPAFKLASMVTKRLLASNEYHNSQMRYRNMNMPGKMSMAANYRYTARVLFRFDKEVLDDERKAVTDIAFCPTNGDILAVGYGIFTFSAMHVPRYGYVAVWNIKNPENPERMYSYNAAVVSVEFSPMVPSLLAVGLYDGTVEVRDISDPTSEPLAVSQRISSGGFEPVVAIKWITLDPNNENEKLSFLALAQDSVVTKYSVINSPYLLGFRQMVLGCVEGMPEGLPVNSNEIAQKASQQPQGMDLTMHPIHTDIYYILTNQGCLHKCSTNYQHQHLEVWRTHDGCVNNMDFSPWSPKMFLTTGNDWCIRIWIDGIFTPLLTLRNHYVPVHCAYWSRTHSTVIVAINRRTVEIWDLRQNILQPVSETQLDKSNHTMAKFTRCGRCIAVGNERGTVMMLAIDDMPFTPHFQYDELEKAIFRALETNPELTNEMKSLGYFGYQSSEKKNTKKEKPVI